MDTGGKAILPLVTSSGIRTSRGGSSSLICIGIGGCGWTPFFNVRRHGILYSKLTIFAVVFFLFAVVHSPTTVNMNSSTNTTSAFLKVFRSITAKVPAVSV